MGANLESSQMGETPTEKIKEKSSDGQMFSENSSDGQMFSENSSDGQMFSESSDNRIINGTTAPQHSFPWYSRHCNDDHNKVA